jgi:hypothetical protein
MNNKLVVALILNFVVLISTFTLIRLILIPGHHIDPPFRLRFIYFLGIHILIFCSIFIGATIEKIYNYFLLGIINCLTIAISFSICEQVVKPLEANAHYYYQAADATSERIQLTYIFLYYIVYTYAIIGTFICGIFIIATEALIRYEEKKFNEYIDICLEKMDLSYNLEEIECAICLEETKG